MVMIQQAFVTRARTQCSLLLFGRYTAHLPMSLGWMIVLVGSFIVLGMICEGERKEELKIANTDHSVCSSICFSGNYFTSYHRDRSEWKIGGKWLI